jgi:hypothetical protein
LLLLQAAWAAGCGPTEPLARISGKVTFEGAPVQEGLIVFSSTELGVHIMAKINDGSYRVVTERGVGLPPGDYQVAISPPLIDHPVGPILEPPRPVVYRDIPNRYHDIQTSGLSTELREGENVKDFEMAP